MNDPQQKTTVAPRADEIAFEVEAFMTSAIRFDDSLRAPLWNRFTLNDPLPKKWSEVLRKVPDDLRARIEEHRDFIRRLNNYRNYIEHCDPVGGRYPHAEAIRFPSVGVGTSFYLPDNPEVREAKKATHEKRLDALTYCWTAASREIEVARYILKAVGEYPSRYLYPDEDY